MKERNTNGIASVVIEGTKEVLPVLVADLNAGQKNVIVSEKVLEYLIGLLPKASFNDIRNVFVDNVMQTKDMGQYVDVIGEEIRFHSSVNMIRKYYNVEEPQPTAVAVRQD